MKKLTLLFASAAALVMAISCEPEDGTQKIKIQLTNEDGTNLAQKGIKVVVASDVAAFDETTDSKGVAAFKLPVGVYEATVSFTSRGKDGNSTNYNGKASVTIEDPTVNPDAAAEFKLPVIVSSGYPLIIKEIYVGGCLKNDASGTYANDKYLILYNNSGKEYDASNICIGNAYPANAHGTNAYITDGKLLYKDWMPSGWAFWGFKSTTTVKIPAYSQIVISIYGAVNHTETYTNSVDLSKADYVMYDTESGFNNKTMYPAPAEGIPATNYMKAYKYGQGVAWAIGNFSPALYLFTMDAATAESFIANTANLDYTCGEKMPNAKIPLASIVDGVESFNYPNLAKSQSRFILSVDAGHVNYTNGKGYTLYRNVDQEATEALPENKGKLVYNYTGGTQDEEGGSTDPSGIDAEASIKAGAHIIYKDTNNSTNDFHQRKVASIK